MPPPVAIITGAGSGIGRAAAAQFASAGYRLVLAGRREHALQETVATLPAGAQVLLCPADLADASQARAIVDRAVEHFNRLDVLVNNAGEAPNLPIDQHTPELIDHVFRVNAIGPANTIAHAWPVLVRQAGGRIINIATIGIFDPFPGFFAYAAAKAALATMTRSCATEGAPHHIRAFCLAPGAVETAMFRAFMPESEFPCSRTRSPDSVAQVILACARGDHDRDNGHTIKLPNL